MVLKPPRKEDIPIIKGTVRKRKNIILKNVRTKQSMFENKIMYPEMTPDQVEQSTTFRNLKFPEN